MWAFLPNNTHKKRAKTKVISLGLQVVFRPSKIPIKPHWIFHDIEFTIWPSKMLGLRITIKPSRIPIKPNWMQWYSNYNMTYLNVGPSSCNRTFKNSNQTKLHAIVQVAIWLNQNWSLKKQSNLIRCGLQQAMIKPN
jgi:hypothetical protein